MDLTALYTRAITQYQEYQAEVWIVPHSIPILYFGDLRSYWRSARKIVTVGLNPSNVEFLEDRFQVRELRPGSVSDLEQSLCRYFEYNPYSLWFDRGFETLLQPLGASYYGEKYATRPPRWWNPQPNTASHTDICTPLATDPTWSRLPDHVTKRLSAIGFPLWRDLIEALEPDLILISVAMHHLRKLGQLNWRSFPPFYPSEARHELWIADYGGSKIVWGQPQVTPFFHLKNEMRPSAGNNILREAGFL